jgi:hypothetical protein
MSTTPLILDYLGDYDEN